MSQPFVTFLVRIRTNASMTEMGERLRGTLNGRFTPSHEEKFEGADVLEADMLGLWITLSYREQHDEQGTRIYHLVGEIRDDINQPWGDTFIDISPYIQGVLVRRDSPDWYVPELSELLAER